MKYFIGIYIAAAFIVSIYFNLFVGHPIFNYSTALKTELYNPDYLLQLHLGADFFTLIGIPIIIFALYIIIGIRVFDKGK